MMLNPSRRQAFAVTPPLELLGPHLVSTMGWFWGSKKADENNNKPKKICCACPETKVGECMLPDMCGQGDLVLLTNGMCST